MRSVEDAIKKCLIHSKRRLAARHLNAESIKIFSGVALGCSSDHSRD